MSHDPTRYPQKPPIEPTQFAGYYNPYDSMHYAYGDTPPPPPPPKQKQKQKSKILLIVLASVFAFVAVAGGSGVLLAVVSHANNNTSNNTQQAPMPTTAPMATPTIPPTPTPTPTPAPMPTINTAQDLYTQFTDAGIAMGNAGDVPHSWWLQCCSYYPGKGSISFIDESSGGSMIIGLFNNASGLQTDVTQIESSSNHPGDYHMGTCLLLYWSANTNLTPYEQVMQQYC